MCVQTTHGLALFVTRLLGGEWWQVNIPTGAPRARDSIMLRILDIYLRVNGLPSSIK